MIVWRGWCASWAQCGRSPVRVDGEGLRARQCTTGGGEEEVRRTRIVLLTVGGVVLHKVFRLLRRDHVNVTHLSKCAHTHTHTVSQ